MVCETLSQKTRHKQGLVDWLKVKALSSSPSAPLKSKISQAHLECELFSSSSFFLGILGLELRTLHSAGQVLYPLIHAPSPFL
jgi:hypothetical protein